MRGSCWSFVVLELFAKRSASKRNNGEFSFFQIFLAICDNENEVNWFSEQCLFVLPQFLLVKKLMMDL